MTELEKAKVEAIRIIGYRLDNRIDFNQNKIMWEIIEEYQRQLEHS